ncbi:hypothetical protein QBC43DRAFT_310066 [Cladorrhinum sp. PSN259]|nr:hypothetical protein QBC43DRAFT_310066 [Cladorrhinum sp. PSN259]
MFAMSNEAFLALGVVLISLTATLVIIRIAFNIHKTNRFLLEDGFAVAALCFLGAKFGVLYQQILAAMDPDTTVLRTLQLTVAYHFLGTAAMWTSKVSILLILIRLFGTRRWLEVTSIAVIFLSLAIFLASFTVAAISCTPTSEEAYTQPRFLATCLSRANTTAVIRGGAAVALDIIILSLPMPIIYRLSLPTHRKVGLFLVFLVQSFALATGIASMYFKIISHGSSTTWPSTIGTTIDCSVAIMVGCVPALYGAWCTHVSKSEPYSKVRSAVSSFSNSVWHKFQRTSVSGSWNRGSEVSNRDSHQQAWDGSGKPNSSQQHYRVWADDKISESGIPMTPQSHVKWKYERMP